MHRYLVTHPLFLPSLILANLQGCDPGLLTLVECSSIKHQSSQGTANRAFLLKLEVQLSSFNVFNISVLQVEVAVRDNAQRLYGFKLKSVGQGK